MNPKLRRSLPTVWVIVVTLAAVELWMWSFDHLPRRAALLVLLGLVGGLWGIGRYAQHRRETRETGAGEARRSE